MTSRVLTLFFIQFNVPFKFISAHMRQANQKVEPREKQSWHTRKQNLASLTWPERRPRGLPIVGIRNVIDNVHNNNVNFH